MNKINIESVSLAAKECGMSNEMWLEHNIKILKQRCPNSTLIAKLKLMLL